MKITHVLIFMFIAQFVFAQAEELVFVNRLGDLDNRYPDVEGSPYLFEGDWHSADLVSKELKKIPNISTRYNLYTGDFEVKGKEEDAYYKLPGKSFMRVEFGVNEKGTKAENDAEKLIFQTSFHPRFKGKFVNLIYSGNNLVVFRDFRMIISDEAARRVGESTMVKEFRSREDFYFMENGELTPMRTNKKFYIKTFGHKKELEAYFKKNKPDLDTAADLNKLFTFLETLK